MDLQEFLEMLKAFNLEKYLYWFTVECRGNHQLVESVKCADKAFICELSNKVEFDYSYYEDKELGMKIYYIAFF